MAHTQPLVRLVTPAAQGNRHHNSQNAFEDELLNVLSWRGKLDYHARYGSHDDQNLKNIARQAAKEAQDAVDDHQRAAIVTGGTKATAAVQAWTTTIPIIQAAGGAGSTQTNVTGFTINAQDIAQYHLNQLPPTVAIMYDPTNNDVYNQLDKSNKQISRLYATVPNDLTTLDGSKLTAGGGFMIIPNAMYYNFFDDIAKFVDNKGLSVIYFPEQEYKQVMTNQTGVWVHGHDIQSTFRRAANYVDQILKGTLTTLPAFQEAVTYQDD